jgi:2-phospho-L-lactate guanylyltransferase
MPVAAIVPIRSFTDGKERLSAALAPRVRTQIGMAMALRTVTAAESAAMLPAVVTSDEGVASWAVNLGIPVVAEEGGGLNGAARAGVGWATESGLQWLILHSDLPLIVSTDLTDLADCIERGAEVLAPSADGGTTALSAAEPIVFRYGKGSAQRHLSQLSNPVIVTRTGLLHDLDSIDDLDAATAHPEGRWLRDLIS